MRQNAKNKLARPRFYWVEEMEFRGCDKSGKKKLSQALRKNLMRRKVIETDVRDNKKDHNK